MLGAHPGGVGSQQASSTSTRIHCAQSIVVARAQMALEAELFLGIHQLWVYGGGNCKAQRGNTVETEQAYHVRASIEC